MARLFDDAATEYLRIETPIIAGTPFAVGVWFNRDADNESVLFSLVDKDVDNHYFALNVLTAAEANAVRMDVQAAGGASAVTSSGVTNGVWHHALGICATNTDRRVLLDGGSKGTNATDKTPANMDRTAIGYLARATPFRYMSGDIAEVGLWDLSNWPGATGTNKADAFEKIAGSLAAGFSPLHFPLGLVAYWPLIRGLNDKVGGYNLTANGTTVSAHTRIILPHGVQ